MQSRSSLPYDHPTINVSNTELVQCPKNGLPALLGACDDLMNHETPERVLTRENIAGIPELGLRMRV